MGPLKTTVVWYPHTERPTGPMLCQIALDLGESDSTDFPRIVVLEELEHAKARGASSMRSIWKRSSSRALASASN